MFTVLLFLIYQIFHTKYLFINYNTILLFRIIDYYGLDSKQSNEYID